MKAFFTLLISCLVYAISLGGAASAEGQEVYAVADDGTPLTWTVTQPTGTGPWPAVLVIHGGSFVGGDSEDVNIDQCAQDLADAGYIAFAINYRLAPPGSLPGQTSSGRFPDQYNDVHLAVQAARNDGRCNGKVGAVGGSAGGTHAAWCAATGTLGGDRLDVAVCLSGAYDFTDFSPNPNLSAFIDAVTNYVGVAQDDTAALMAASPAWVVDSTVSPLLLLGTQKDPMPAVQPGDMIARLAAVGAKNYQTQTLGGDLHSFAYWPNVKLESLAFLSTGFSTPLPTPTPTANPSGLLNLSTRAHAGSGEDVLIGGFIVGPSQTTKRVIVRALGPSLGAGRVSGALADPSLQLLDSAGHVLGANDNWMEGSQAQEIIAAQFAPNDSRESALIANLAPGAYTAIVSGVNGPQNIALVEVYDLDGAHMPHLLNLSTRGNVDVGEGVMIAGAIIGGTDSQTLVLRGLGPSFATGPNAISNPLPDPSLTLVDANGATILANDNWQDTQAAEITAAGLALTNPLESAIVATLAPGNYTALLSDAHGATGIGLLEIYNLGVATGP